MFSNSKFEIAKDAMAHLLGQMADSPPSKRSKLSATLATEADAAAKRDEIKAICTPPSRGGLCCTARTA